MGLMWSMGAMWVMCLMWSMGAMWSMGLMGSMFVPDNSFLVWDSHGDFSGVFEDHTLAAESAFEPRVDGAVNEIFFFVGDFFEKLLPFFYIDMTGRTGANATAVMVQMYIMLLCKLENGHI